MAGLVNLDLAGLGGAVSSIGGLAKDIRAAITGKSIVDPDKQAEIELKLAELDAQVMAAQSATNLAEVQKGGFAGNWRPALGWLCVVGLACKFFVFPLLTYFGLPAPMLDTSEMMTLVFAMLGLVGARTVEKIKGVAR
jgi:hypothetical protein